MLSPFRRQLLTSTGLVFILLFIINAMSGPGVVEKPKSTSNPAIRKLKNPVVDMKVAGYGDITIELYRQRKPKTVDNFMQYITDGFYDGLIFHRVMKGFMIQTGGERADGTRAVVKYPTLYPEKENFIPNKPYTLSVARAGLKGDSQFFINLVHNTHLDNQDPSFVVFGEVTDQQSRAVVDKIAEANVVNTSGGEHSKAVPPVVITSMKVRPSST